MEDAKLQKDEGFPEDEFSNDTTVNKKGKKGIVSAVIMFVSITAALAGAAFGVYMYRSSLETINMWKNENTKLTGRMDSLRDENDDLRIDNKLYQTKLSSLGIELSTAEKEAKKAEDNAKKAEDATKKAEENTKQAKNETIKTQAELDVALKDADAKLRTRPQ